MVFLSTEYFLRVVCTTMLEMIVVLSAILLETELNAITNKCHPNDASNSNKTYLRIILPYSFTWPHARADKIGPMAYY